jgi:hypothetical protein
MPFRRTLAVFDCSAMGRARKLVSPAVRVCASRCLTPFHRLRPCARDGKCRTPQKDRLSCRTWSDNGIVPAAGSEPLGRRSRGRRRARRSSAASGHGSRTPRRSYTFGFPSSVAARSTFEPVASAAAERRLGVIDIDQIGKPPVPEGVNLPDTWPIEGFVSGVPSTSTSQPQRGIRKPGWISSEDRDPWKELQHALRWA